MEFGLNLLGLGGVNLDTSNSAEINDANNAALLAQTQMILDAQNEEENIDYATYYIIGGIVLFLILILFLIFYK